MRILLMKIVNLIDDSIKQLPVKLDKQIIKNNIKYDFRKNAFVTAVALKAKIPAEQIIAHINLIDSKQLCKEITIKKEFIYFYINDIQKYNLYDEIFNKTILNIFGKLCFKDLTINIQYQCSSDNKNTLSYMRDQYYILALINLLKSSGYIVNDTNNVSMLNSVQIMNQLYKYLYEVNNTLYFDSEPLLINHQFTKYAKYICTYINRCNKINERAITICGNGYSIAQLQRLNKLLSLNYSILFESEPVIILDKNKQLSNQLALNRINFDQNAFKYACVSHNINNTFIFNINKNDKFLFVKRCMQQIDALLLRINNVITNQWFKTDKWLLFKYDEMLLNYLSTFELMLNYASKNLNLPIVEQYLFKLCCLSKRLIRSIFIILNHHAKHEYVDLPRLKNKIKILLIVRYVINFVMNIFNIRV